MFHTLTLSKEYHTMLADIADLYGSEMLYFHYENSRYIGCFDSLDSIVVSDTTIVYEATNKASHRVY